MFYNFKLTNTEYKEKILSTLDILIPTDDNYFLGFVCEKSSDYYTYRIKVYLEQNSGDYTRIYNKPYNSSLSVLQIQKLYILSDDNVWNFGLEGYRMEQGSKETLQSSNNEEKNVEKEFVNKLKKEYKPLDGAKYAKNYTFAERRELKKLKYFDYCSYYASQATLFEYLLAKASNYEKMSFEKLKLITIGYRDYLKDVNNDVLWYSEYFLTEDSINKIHEISKIDSTTTDLILNIKEFVEKEKAEYERICKLTIHKKEELLYSTLETEKIKYMIDKGISVQDAFYYVDKEAQKTKNNILDCYIKLSKNKNEDFSTFDFDNKENILCIAKYLIDNVQKRDVEIIIDYALMDSSSYDITLLSSESLDHISYIKIILKDNTNTIEAQASDSTFNDISLKTDSEVSSDE